MVLGSSLVVSPAADLPAEAQDAGACLVLWNVEDTPYDNVYDLRIERQVGEVMEAVLQTVKTFAG